MSFIFDRSEAPKSVAMQRYGKGFETKKMLKNSKTKLLKFGWFIL